MSTTTMFGTPVEVTLSELAIESFFPADAETAERLRTAGRGFVIAQSAMPEGRVDAPYAIVEQLEPGIARLLARNPSPFTYFGTQTYLVGEEELVVIDPGPDLPEHVEAIVAALDGRSLAAIACTHTHRDHSPASRGAEAKRPARRSSAARRWCWRASARAPTPASTSNMRRTRCWPTARRSSSMAASGWSRWRRPGTPRNHLCFAFGDALFTGDHVMGWSTTVVVPPDGDMAAYMRSLELLRQRERPHLLSRRTARR